MLNNHSFLKKTGLILFLLIGTLSVFSQCIGVAPDRIVIDSVSVDAFGNVIVSWQPSNSTNIAPPNIATYTIRRIDPVTGANQDLIPNISINDTTFTIPKNFFVAPNNVAQTDIEVDEYAVYVTDTCGVGLSSLTIYPDDFHNTMLLKSTTDSCANTITLNWNPYDDFGSIANYTVFVKEDAGAFFSAGTTFDTTFTFTNVNQGSVYEFYIRATENNGFGPYTSSSNRDTVNDDFLKEPRFSYVYNVTVIDSQQVDIAFVGDTDADIDRYLIKRALDSNDLFVTVGVINSFPSMNPFQEFSDTDPDLATNERTYYYKVDVVDVCNTLKTPTNANLGKTILLKAVSDDLNGRNILNWDNYVDWAGGVDRYQIYRSIGGVWDSDPIAIIDADSPRTYVDDITRITSGNGEFCYRVQAVEGPATRLIFLGRALSESNDACVIHQPLVYIPNAFDPFSSFNPEFKPVLTFADPLAYELIIYNRWGQEIFKTNDVSEGWRGQKNGSQELVQVGVYVYKVNFQSASGEVFSKTGHVNLIR